MVYGKSNGYVTDDVTWPWKVKLVTPVRLEYNISKQLAMLITIDSLLWGSTVGYRSDSLASCYLYTVQRVISLSLSLSLSVSPVTRIYACRLLITSFCLSDSFIHPPSPSSFIALSSLDPHLPLSLRVLSVTHLPLLHTLVSSLITSQRLISDHSSRMRILRILKNS